MSESPASGDTSVLAPGEEPSFAIDRVAVLPTVAHPALDVHTSRHPQLQYRSVDPRIRSVGSLGIASMLEGAIVDLREHDQGNGHDERIAAAQPARLIVTDRRVVAITADGNLW